MKPPDTSNSWKRRALAILAVALLSVPSAIGVQHALEPTRGPVASWLAAGGFELVYISTAILLLSAELRDYSRRVAMAAVVVAVLLNTIADYQTRTAVYEGSKLLRNGLSSWHDAQALFDPLALVLSLLESTPLAGLACAMAELLHRLSDAQDQPDQQPIPIRPPRVAWARDAAYPVPIAVSADQGFSMSDALEPVSEAPIAPETAGFQAATRKTYACKHCGASGLTFAELGRHSRSHKEEQQ